MEPWRYENTLLLTDLDGTLLTDDKEIHPLDRQAIKQFRQNGGHFTIATGRSLTSARPYLEALKVTEPVILFNGACIYDVQQQKMVYTAALPDAVRRYVSVLLEQFPETGAEIVLPDRVYVVRSSQQEQLHIELSRETPTYCDLEDVPDGSWMKVLFAAPPEIIPKMQAYVEQIGWTEADFMQSSDIFYEMLPVGITKGSALTIYRQQCPANWHFATAGDYENDITLLKQGDLSAAPANAQPCAKAAADIQLDVSCNDGAIAAFLSVINSRIQKMEVL